MLLSDQDQINERVVAIRMAHVKRGVDLYVFDARFLRAVAQDRDLHLPQLVHQLFVVVLANLYRAVQSVALRNKKNAFTQKNIHAKNIHAKVMLV